MNQFKIFLLSILFSLSLNTAFAQAYVIKSFDVDMELEIDGDINVKERITVEFNEQRRGIMRDIPKAMNVDGEIQRVQLKNVNVDAYDYKLLSQKNKHVIRIGNPDIFLTGTHTYDISYTLKNVFIRESDHTALQYNITSDWDTYIDTVTYNITLPKDIDMHYSDYRVFTGLDNANERGASILKEGNRIYGNSYARIGEQENITIAVKFPVDYFQFPPPPPPLFKRDKSWFAPIGIFILVISFFRRFRNRDYATHISDVHYPPDDMSPAEVGTFIDGKPHTRDFIGLLPYWANKKYIEIIGEDGTSEDYTLFFKKINELDPALPNYQHTLFEGIFKGENLVALSELKEKIYKVTYKASKEIKEYLKEKQLYDEEERSLFHSGKMFVYSFFLILAAVLIIIKTGWLLTGLGLIGLGILCIVLFAIPVRKSEKGFRLHEELKSLNNFLKDGSGESLNRLLDSDPAYFNKLYPFTIALGIDEAWMNRMSDYDLPSPDWFYYGHDQPYARSSRPIQDFSQNFNVAKISSVFKSTPPPPVSSSGGSSGGFSGGGSSGGGFGGGGSSW